jgi:hypothetical protein
LYLPLSGGSSLDLAETLQLTAQPEALVSFLNQLPEKSGSVCNMMAGPGYQIIVTYGPKSLLVGVSRNCSTVWQGGTVRGLDHVNTLLGMFESSPTTVGQ